ncbi:MAG: ribbon-helix-helix domain-containing protein [Promethearchaeota archaeon]
MKMITLYIPTKYLEAIDLLVANDYYPNRSEAIRVGIRDLIYKELKLNEVISNHKENIEDVFAESLKDIK